MNKKIFIIPLLFIFNFTFLAEVSALHVFPGSAYPGKNKDGKVQNLNLNFSVQSGVMMGGMDEFVFDGEKKKSELNWDLIPIVYIGFNMNFNYRFFFLSFGYWSSIYDGKVGYIEDRDWDTTDGSYDQYSKHNCRLEAAHFTDIVIYFVPYTHRFFNLNLALGFNYKIIKVMGFDGFFQYPPTSPRDYKNGNFIRYEQEYFIPFLGIAFSFFLPEDITIGISFYYSPFAVCDAVDNHLLRKLDFFDLITFGQYISTGLELGYKINSDVSINLNFQYIKMLKSKGDSYTYDVVLDATTSIIKNGAGAGFEVYNISLGVKYNVFTL